VKEFYSKVFGWTFSDYQENYFFWSDNTKNMSGGLTKTESIVNSGKGIVPYIYTDDVDSLKINIEKHGGNITSLEKEDHGCILIFKDTEGNTMGAYQEN
jgi:uncharacterized protein